MTSEHERNEATAKQNERKPYGYDDGRNEQTRTDHSRRSTKLRRTTATTSDDKEGPTMRTTRRTNECDTNAPNGTRPTDAQMTDNSPRAGFAVSR